MFFQFTSDVYKGYDAESDAELDFYWIFGP